MKKLATLGVLIALTIAGCGGVVNSGDAKKLDPVVKVFNLCPDANSIDFYMNDSLYEQSVGYVNGSADFKSVEFLDPDQDEGFYDVYARQSGFLGDLDRIASKLEREKTYLYLGIGLKSPGNELLKRFRVTQLEINRDRPVGNKANLQVVHGFCSAEGSETPNITLQTPGDNPQFKIQDIPFAASRTLQIDAGTYNFEARRADTDNNTYVSNSFTFQSGALYLVAITGIEGKTGALAPKITFLQMSTK